MSPLDEQPDDLSRNDIVRLRERIRELEALVGQRDSTIADLREQLRATERARAEIIGDFSKNNAEEQMYSLQKSVSELHDQNVVLRQTVGLCPRMARPTLMCANPHWTSRSPVTKDRLCFLLMPFSEKWSDDVWNAVKDAADACRLECLRADQDHDRKVMEQIWGRICEARFVVADLTAQNPNVAYEFGLADVVGKHVILQCQTPDIKKLPFDFHGERLIQYEADKLEKLTVALTRKMQHALGGPQATLGRTL